VDAGIVVAICATVIAVASLMVSVYEARATRTHNRHSVRPILGLRHNLPVGGTAGLRLTNSGSARPPSPAPALPSTASRP
jgi:hypothetical protein